MDTTIPGHQTRRDLYLTEIRRLPEKHKFYLAWDNGESVEVDYDLVRGFCPCALCQGHDSIEIVFHQPRRPVTPEYIEPVGNYAISIQWSDRHSTGIYRFDFLHRIAQADGSGGSMPRNEPAT